MKNNKLIYSLMLAGGLAITACQKNEINVAPANLAPVSNLSYTLNGDTVQFSWSLPQSSSPVKVVFDDGATSKELDVNATTFKYGIVETNKDYTFSFKASDANGNLSLGEIVKLNRAGAAPVKDVDAKQEESNVIVSWAAPAQPVTKIQVKLGTQTLDLSPSATSCQFHNISKGSYTISVVTTNSANQVSNTVYLPFKVGPVAVAYVGVYADSTALLSTGDDDEIAAAKWLFGNYAKSEYVSFNEIKNGTVDLSQFRVLWWNFDVQTGSALPAVATDATVVSKITTFYKNGGNLLFDKYALQYFANLGRITEPYFAEYGNGDGFNNPDTWGIGVKIGKKKDKSQHPLYKGISMTTQSDNRITFPIISGGWKENHNAVYIRIPEYLKLEPNDNDAAYNKFASDNALEWLGQWDGMGDYWMVGMFELKPKNDYQGSAIFLGIGAIEWNQISGPNQYQSTVEKLYKNAIDYLKTK